MFLGMLLAFPLVLAWTKDKVSFETCIYFYSLGIILSTVLALLFNNNANLLEYIRVIEEKEVVTRHCGFYGDPNFYSAQVITAIGGQLLIILRNAKGRIIGNIISIAVLIACGLTSVSKSYMLCLVLLAAVGALCFRRKDSGKYFRIFVVAFALFAFALLSIGAFSDIIDQYLLRFTMGDGLSSLTTNRTAIWKAYLKFFFENPLHFLLGQGYTNVLAVDIQKSSHNTIIQCVYQLGIIGSVFIISWFNSVVATLKPGKVKGMYVILLLVACFSMWMGLDFLFFDDFFLTIILFALGLSYIQEEKLSKIQKNS